MMKFLRPIQVLIFATYATGPVFAPVAHARTSPPWWQQIVKKTVETAAQKAENAFAKGSTHQKNAVRPTSTASTPIASSSGQSTPGAPSVSSISPDVLLPFTKQTIIFRGSGFGHADPFNGPSCFLRFVDITNQNLTVGATYSGFFGWNAIGTFYVTKWTNTEIVINGISNPITQFHPGDLVRIDVANPQMANDNSVHGICGSPAAKLFVHVATTLPGPKISSFSDGGTQTPVSGSRTTSVSTILPVAKQTITINGSGFGEHTAFQGHSRFLQLTDITDNNWTSGASCANGCGTGPSVDVKSWTDSQIVLGGFLSGYGGADVLHPGDLIRVSIADPQLAGDMGSVNSVFGGSPATKIFVTVANPASPSAMLGSSTTGTSHSAAIAATGNSPSSATTAEPANAPLPQAATSFAQVHGYNCSNEAPLSSLPTEVTKIEKLYGRNAAAVMVPKIQLESAKEMATGIVEANPPNNPALTQEFESLGRVSDGAVVIGDILGTVQVIQLSGGIYQIVGGELGNAVDKYVKAGYGWGQEFDWCYSTNTEDLNVLPFKVVPVPGESPAFKTAPPSISDVSPIVASATQSITIDGQGLGTHSPYDGDSPYLMIRDDTGNWMAGQGMDLVHLKVRSWMSSDIPARSKIVISGFSGAYDAPLTNWKLKPGDRITVYAWNTDTGAGPAQYNLSVAP